MEQHEVTREEIVNRAIDKLKTMTEGDQGGLLLTFDNEAPDFGMLSINSSEQEIIQMLVLAMETMRDIAAAKHESEIAAKTGALN